MMFSRSRVCCNQSEPHQPGIWWFSWKARSAKALLTAALAIGLPALTIGPTAHAAELVTPAPHPKRTPVDPGFIEWIEDFRAEALGKGISAQTFDDAFAGARIEPRIVELNARQPEFDRQIWTYLDGAVSDLRIQKGQELVATHQVLLDDVSQRYNVPPQIIAAIWGIETSYGAILGDYDVISALATLAYKTRRANFGRRELISALTILENGYATKAQLTGSWAGAMGHTQFIPTAYLERAVDYDGDGRRDLWTNLGDIFASTANYLARSKWNMDESWGREIKLPDGFDLTIADRTIRKPVAEWQAMGVTAASGSLASDAQIVGAIILPGGHTGPAFLVYDNFRVIMTYNNSTSYAMAVAHLADRIAGGSAIQRSWPVEEPALSRSNRKDLQNRLVLLGYDPGGVDGVVGAQTRAALKRYQADRGLPADGFPSLSVRTRLKADADAKQSQ